MLPSGLNDSEGDGESRSRGAGPRFVRATRCSARESRANSRAHAAAVRLDAPRRIVRGTRRVAARLHARHRRRRGHAGRAGCPSRAATRGDNGGQPGALWTTHRNPGDARARTGIPAVAWKGPVLASAYGHIGHPPVFGSRCAGPATPRERCRRGVGRGWLPACRPVFGGRRRLSLGRTRVRARPGSNRPRGRRSPGRRHELAAAGRASRRKI